MKRNKNIKNKRTPRQLKSKEVFDLLMDWATEDLKMPKRVVEAVDFVANYAGDIAMGRRK